MEKNKSIDGLVSRRSKKTVSKNTSKNSSKNLSSKPSKKSPKPLADPSKDSLSSLADEFNSSSAPKEPSIKSQPVNPIEDFLQPVQAFDFDEKTGQLQAIQATPHQKPKKEKKSISKKRKIIVGIILTIVLLVIGAITWLVLWGNDIIAKITGGQGNVLDLLSLASETYEPLKTDENGRTNILAFGTSGYNMEGEEGNGVHDGAQLTDSIMVISLDQETGDVAMLSLPRDLKVSATCTATSKINELYWCNNMAGDNEQAGAEALMSEVSNILGLEFQYYAHLNWGSLIQIVDTLGGINVTLDEDISDYYYTGAVFKAGVEYTIDGGQALGLARARHGTTSGDFSRGASQQKILIGIKNKVFEKNLSLSEIMNLASTLGDNLRTNFSLEEMKTLAHLTSNFDFDTIRQVSLIEPNRLMTTGNINGISYVLPSGGANYYLKIQEYVAKMFSSDPRTYEESTILVLNGGDEVGVAATEKIALEEAGYTNIYIDDAPEGEYSNGYTLYALTNTAPGTKKLLEEKYNQTAKLIEELPEGVSKDYDFVLIIGSTTED